MNYLDEVLSAQKSGRGVGITSVCSAHPFVVEAALRHGLEGSRPVLIEATCNQVNQYGGYTGMKPLDFAEYVGRMADELGFGRERLILGGDHLGPLPWANESATNAMDKARVLARDYARAGFAKIHLDCSAHCAGEVELSVEEMSKRAAELARVVEEAVAGSGAAPRYVIGTEVPPAGGARVGEGELAVTDPADAAATIEITRRAFSALGLQAAWERVIALVVQPGVEFGDAWVHPYQPAAAAALAGFIEAVPGLIYEAHSSDYQSRLALRSLVQDHSAILKVGPALTFAFREAVFGLSEVEEAVLRARGQSGPLHPLSQIREALEAAMLANPLYWEKHFSIEAGLGEEKRRIAENMLFYGYSDRIRYYWNVPNVRKAFALLLKNLGAEPLPFLSQLISDQVDRVRDGRLQNHPRAFLLGRVMSVLDDYAFAVRDVVSTGGNMPGKPAQ